MSNTQTFDEDTETRAIKSNCAYQVRCRKEAEADLVRAHQVCVKSWKMLYNAGIRTELENMIWTYVESGQFYKSTSTKLIGIKSIISQYTNKKGKSHMAHFTVNGCYLGPVSKLGEEPTYYQGNIHITKEHFVIDLSQFDTHTGIGFGGDFSGLFVNRPTETKVNKSTKKRTGKKFVIIPDSDDEDEDEF